MTQLGSELGLAVDLHGCPNRCRHCWLGQASRGRLTGDDLRRMVSDFRDGLTSVCGESDTPILKVMSWYREPDFSPRYRELWALENELSDGDALRFELLSIWRLARDEDYARWARAIGTQACQITLFGLQKNTDWFMRRKGAFRDALLATERLLEAGIAPRWQVFVTKRNLTELDALAELIVELDLERRVRDLGHTFDAFLHTPSPDGEAFAIEHLRPEVADLRHVNAYWTEKTLAHGRAYAQADTLADALGRSEADLVQELGGESRPYADLPARICLMVAANLDVYSNLAEPMPWWRLGNLKNDSVDTILTRFLNDETVGARGHFMSIGELAQRYGRPDSARLYERDDLIIRWLHLWSLKHYTGA